MIANTLEQYRNYTGECFSRIKSYDTVAQMWEERSKEYAQLVAIEYDGKSYTYAQLAEDVAKYRTVLKSKGVSGRVALLIPNSYDFVKAFLAAVTLGCTAAVLPAHLDEKSRLAGHLLYDRQIGRAAVTGAFQIHQMRMGSALRRKVQRNLLRMLAVYRHLCVIAFVQTHSLSFKQVNRRKKDHAIPSVSQKAFRIRNPTSPLFSGWN